MAGEVKKIGGTSFVVDQIRKGGFANFQKVYNSIQKFRPFEDGMSCEKVYELITGEKVKPKKRAVKQNKDIQSPEPSQEDQS